MATDSRDLDVVVHIEVSESELLNRLGGRYVCRDCQSPHSIGVGEDTSFWGIFWVMAIIIGILEVNAIIGKPGPMASVKGVIHSGIILTIVLFGAIGFLI